MQTGVVTRSSLLVIVAFASKKFFKMNTKDYPVLRIITFTNALFQDGLQDKIEMETQELVHSADIKLYRTYRLIINLLNFRNFKREFALSS
jgi:hypothetical protein